MSDKTRGGLGGGGRVVCEKEDNERTEVRKCGRSLCNEEKGGMRKSVVNEEKGATRRSVGNEEKGAMRRSVRNEEEGAMRRRVC